MRCEVIGSDGGLVRPLGNSDNGKDIKMGRLWNEYARQCRLAGDEIVGENSDVVSDFWRWAYGDLRMNNVRGHFAEFLVARAVGCPFGRVEWAPYDIAMPRSDKFDDAAYDVWDARSNTEYIRIEVKSSAYVQSWAQRRPSSLRFGRLWSSPQALDPESGEWHKLPCGVYDDVFVFAMQRNRKPEFDPLNLDEWSFRLASRATVISTVRPDQEVGVRWIERHSSIVDYSEIKRAVLSAASTDGQ